MALANKLPVIAHDIDVDILAGLGGPQIIRV